MKMLFRILLPAFLVLLTSTVATANDDVVGIWQTESSERGYIYVSIAPCDNLMCGTILKAYNLEHAEIEDYEHVGKNMVWGMRSNGKTSWNRGKIWDPSKNKTYKSNMVLSGNTLKVSGCVLLFCRSQNWQRVEAGS